MSPLDWLREQVTIPSSDVDPDEVIDRLSKTDDGRKKLKQFAREEAGRNGFRGSRRLKDKAGE